MASTEMQDARAKYNEALNAPSPTDWMICKPGDVCSGVAKANIGSKPDGETEDKVEDNDYYNGIGL